MNTRTLPLLLFLLLLIQPFFITSPGYVAHPIPKM
jgi:hypothetical protein